MNTTADAAVATTHATIVTAARPPPPPPSSSPPPLPELVSVASDSKFGTDPSVWTDHVANRHLDGGLVEALLQ